MTNRSSLARAATALALALTAISFGVVGCEEGSPMDVIGADGGSVATRRFHHRPGHGGGGGGGGTEPIPATVTITTAIPGAGLYGDGAGTYAGTLDGSLTVSPPCPREFRLDLTGEGLSAPFDQVIPDCGFPPRLTIEDGLLAAQVGDILGSPVAPGSTNMGAATNYYFEDSSGKTYNVIWQAGMRVTGISAVDNGNGTTTTTYTLSTDPDLADDADLVTRAVKGKPRTQPVCPATNPDCDGSVVAHLELTVEVTQ